MKTYTKKDLGKGTIELLITLDKDAIKKEFDVTFDKALTEVEVEGFRKGKAPKDMASKLVDREKVYEKVIGELIPVAYEEVLKKESLTPATQPHVELVNGKEGEDWVIKITLALRPVVTLGDYKKIVKDVKGDMKKDEIWVPGKEVKPEDKNKSEENKRKMLNVILDKLAHDSTVEMSDLIMKDEVNRRLTQLLDDVKQIGMTVEEYARSKNTTLEAMKAQFEHEIEDMYKIELGLEKISDEAKITVEESDLAAMLGNITDPKAKEQAQKNAYFYATVIKRQKTLDHLLSL